MSENLEQRIERAFLDNVCRVAECTGLSYSTFERIAEFGYNLAVEDVKEELTRRLNGWHCADFSAEIEKGVSGDDGLLSWVENLNK